MRPARRAAGVAAILAATAVASSLLLAPTANASGNNDRLGTDLYVLATDGGLWLLSGDDVDDVVNYADISGLDDGERLVGIDTRPATGGLYAISDRGQLYLVDGLSGEASKVGAPVVLSDGPLTGDIGFDFNPTVDRIRVVTSTGQNARLVPDTGAVAATDGDLTYAATDRNAGRMPGVSGAGYTNSVGGATTTLLYDIDADRNVLVTQGSAPGVTPAVGPNTGQLFTVGRLGLNASSVNGFDIAGEQADPTMFDPAEFTAVLASNLGSRASVLARVDLETGRARVFEVMRGQVAGIAFAVN